MKYAVKPFIVSELYKPLELKSISLLFDKVLVNANNLDELKKGVAKAKYHKAIAMENLSELEFLIENDLVATYNYDGNINASEIDDNVRKIIIDFLMNFTKDSHLIEKDVKTLTDPQLDKFLQIGCDYEARMISLNLSKIEQDEFYPLLYNANTYQNDLKKQDVLTFLLKQFPFPNEQTSWEQIIDFRSDPDSKSKYLALVHWANNVASSNKSINEIEDEYNYLYDQYSRHFKLHKMKTTLTTWEMIIVGGIDMLTSMHGTPTFIKNLFSISKTKLALMEEEMKLPGKEIAYIYEANETFK